MHRHWYLWGDKNSVVTCQEWWCWEMPAASPHERERLLLDIGGANPSQIMKGSMLANYDNKLRWQSFDRWGGENHYKSIGPRERMLIMKESARRKFDRACKGTSTLQEQQDLWDNVQEITLTKQLQRQTTVWDNIEDEAIEMSFSYCNNSRPSNAT